MYRKINSKWIKDLNVKSDTIKPLEKNRWNTLWLKLQEYIFLDPFPIVKKIKANINYWDLVKRFWTAKEISNKVKRQSCAYFYFLFALLSNCSSSLYTVDKNLPYVVTKVFPNDLHLLSFIPICSCCLVAKSCPTLCHSMYYSTPDSPVLHELPEFAKIHFHWVSDAI